MGLPSDLIDGVAGLDPELFPAASPMRLLYSEAWNSPRFSAPELRE